MHLSRLAQVIDLIVSTLRGSATTRVRAVSNVRGSFLSLWFIVTLSVVFLSVCQAFDQTQLAQLYLTAAAYLQHADDLSIGDEDIRSPVMTDEVGFLVGAPCDVATTLVRHIIRKANLLVQSYNTTIQFEWSTGCPRPLLG